MTAVQLTINVQATDGGTSDTNQLIYTGLGEVKYQGSIPDTTSTAGQLIALSFPHADVNGVYIRASQNMTLNTNSDSAPAQSISLTANQMLVGNPFTADVTAIYARNASLTTAATLTILIVLNNSLS